VSLEVVTQLPGSNENHIKQLMYFKVPCLGVLQDFTDVVHRALDGPDPPERIRRVYLYGLALQGFLAPRIREGLRVQGPRGFLFAGRYRCPQELEPDGNMGPDLSYRG
jgi:hypothetical protein